MLNSRFEIIKDKVVTGIKEYFSNAGFEKAVLGLSGGIDSAVVAYLAVEALGVSNVTGIKMPYKSSSSSSIEDADKVIAALKMNGLEISITDPVDSFTKLLKNGEEDDLSSLRLGNIMARCRMITLFDFSANTNALVLGTSNKSELLLGYGTLYGDLASIVNPLGGLYKTEVFALARLLGIDEALIAKAPSADLEEGQSDEKDFGFTYDDADKILAVATNKNMSQLEIYNLGFPKELFSKVLDRYNKNKFKAKLPVILEV